ncbi:MAG: ABC transporter ATP-binding protein [Rhodospirillaceae bacterium]|nr:ABC transporter ATP-binding protein [Rhodospirillaceae bacterium]
MIKVEGLNKSFSGRTVLENVDFEISQGKSLVIIGGSGSGKSVLVKCIAGLYQPDAGKITLGGKRVDENSSDNFSANHRIGYVFQNAALFDSMTIIENIAFSPINQLKKTKREALEIAAKNMSILGLSQDIGKLYPEAISTGMRKSVAIARAMASDPDIILFDEPTTGLDPHYSKKIDHLIRSCITDHNITALTITHDMSSAKRIADEIAMLYEGKLIWSGSPHELDQPGNKQVATFVHSMRHGQRKLTHLTA